MNGAVSVSPYTWVIVQPSSPSILSIVAAAGGAPAVATRTPATQRPAARLGPAGDAMSTVGAAHSCVMPSWFTSAIDGRRIDLAAGTRDAPPPP